MGHRRAGLVALLGLMGLVAVACGGGVADGSDIGAGADIAATDTLPAPPDAALATDAGTDLAADGLMDLAADLLEDLASDVALADLYDDAGLDLEIQDAADASLDVAVDLTADVPLDLPPPPCGPEPYGGAVMDLWDMPFLTDASTLDLEVVATWTEGFPPTQITELRYTSYEVSDCTVHPIRVEAYVAMPLSAVGSDGALPGVVKAHGLGGSADANAAAGPARELGVAVLAYSGPGQGLSEGTGSTPDHLFDTIPDPRASWFWEHAVAGIRGLSVLATLPEVDPGRLGMTGYSGGSVATLMVNGVDPRVEAAVPVSACGYMDLAAAATPVPGWQANLLAAMTEPQTPASPLFAAYVDYLDPKNYLATAQGETLLINGAQDEFFPIHSFTLTFDGLGGGAAGHRVLVIKDWDHGPLAMLYGTEEVEAKTLPTLGAWFRRVFGLDAAVAELPPMPQVTVEPWTCLDPDTWLVWDCALAGLTLSAPTGYEIEAAALHWSVDGLTYFSWNLQDQGAGLWAAEVGALDGATAGGLVYFAEVELGAGGLFGPSFWLTSRPHIPEGFVPEIIPMP